MLGLIGRLNRALRGETAPDLRLAETAAAALGCGLYRLYEIAYRDWFGRPPRQKDLERVFMRSFYVRRVPPWVRQFARNVIRLAEAGRLDPAAYGLPRRPPETMSVAEFERWSALIYLVALALILFAVPALAGG